MSDCPVQRDSVAGATIVFLDLLEETGRLWPRSTQDLPPDEPQELVNALSRLECELNPGRFAYEDRRRVAHILAWATAANDPYVGEEDPTAVPLAGLAVTVDTIIRWWGLGVIATRDEWSLEKPPGWPPFVPRLLAEQMRAAATAVGTGSRVRWQHPLRKLDPATPETVESVRRHADDALMAVREILDDLRRQPDANPSVDHMLLWHYHEMIEAAAGIPLRGWEPCHGNQAFREFGASGRCGHLAVINLAERVSLAFGNAAWQAIQVRWGGSLRCHLVPLIWTPEARPLLEKKLSEWGQLDLRFWLQQLAIESSRFRCSKAGQATKRGRRKKRETKSRDEVIAALSRWHQYEEDGSVGNYQPATNRSLELRDNAALSRFLKSKGGIWAYQAACRTGKIGALLKVWRGDVSAHPLGLRSDESEVDLPARRKSRARSSD